MTTVRFANVCDQCGKRSDEYSVWPTCFGCCDDVCFDCCATYREDEGRYKDVVCKKCTPTSEQ